METSFGDIATDRVVWLFMPRLDLFEFKFGSMLLFPTQNAGRDGAGRDTLSLFSITLTVDILGLSTGFS